MKRSTTTIVVALAAVLAMLVAATAAVASGPKHNTLYRYVGQVQATSTASVKVAVQNGNRAALRSLIGESQEQTFTTDDKTVFIRWTGGTPTKVAISDLQVNDYVTVNVRTKRNAHIGKVTEKPAASVADRGQTLNKPTQPLSLFRGTFVSAGDDSVTIKVKGGNRNALKLMLGQSGSEQTFRTDGSTVFLHWAHRVPEISPPTNWKAGDRIIVRIRADRGSTLAEVEATAAKRVADREPKSQEKHQSDQA